MQNNDTIISLATPAIESALGLIRISGPLCKNICNKTFNLKYPTPRKAYLRNYRSVDNKIIDQVILIFYEQGKSFTNEPIIEITFHGNIIIANQILDDLIDRGCRIADPGEYSKRAFLNGKIDLTQAESISELISAKSEAEIKIANNNLRGNFKNHLKKVSNRIIKLQSILEANIDFPEDDIESANYDNLQKDIDELIEKFENYVKSAEIGINLKNGIKILLIGPPNAGKSSIFNRLVINERAIVHDQPGTTRDYISENILIGKFNVELIDTAGIRIHKTDQEGLGIKHSIKLINDSNIILLILDSSIPYPPDFDDKIKNFLVNKKIIVIENKSDLDRVITDDNYPKNSTVIKVSTKNKSCRSTVIKEIEHRLVELFPKLENKDIIVNKRQLGYLKKSLKSLHTASKMIDKSSTEEFIVQELKLSLDAINHITGQTTNEEMLDELFANFCIGK